MGPGRGRATVTAPGELPRHTEFVPLGASLSRNTVRFVGEAMETVWLLPPTQLRVPQGPRVALGAAVDGSPCRGQHSLFSKVVLTRHVCFLQG